MKKILKFTALSAVLLIFVGGGTSCTKEKNISLEIGLYIETSNREILPTINFIDKKRLVIDTDDLGVHGEFMYEISENVIRLTNVADPHDISERYFRIINCRKFEIWYLYPHCCSPCPPPMIFEKKIEN